MLPPTPAAPPWRRNLRILAATVFLTMVSFSMVLPFLPLYLKEMGVTRGIETWSGLIYGASFLSGGIMAPVWGVLGDRFGQKAMLLRAGASIAAVNALMALAATPGQLVFLRLLNGLLGGFLPASNALVTASVPAGEVGSALSVIQVATSAGAIAGPLVGGLLADALGMRETFLCASAAMAATTLLVAAFVAAPARAAAVGAGGGGSAFSLLGRPALRNALLVVFTVQLGASAVQPVLALLVERMAAGAASFQSGAVFSAASLAGLAGTPAFAALARSRAPARLLAVAAGGAGLTTILQGLSASVLQLSAARLGFGFFQGGAAVLGNTLVAGAVPPERQGGAFGLASSAWMLGAVAGPVAGGLAASAWGLSGPFWLAGAVLVALSRLDAAPDRGAAPADGAAPGGAADGRFVGGDRRET